MRVSATIGRAGLPPMNATSRYYGDWALWRSYGIPI
jgi:hypothetical protein